jgi:GNAT superfamily N-acetyltransferase
MSSTVRPETRVEPVAPDRWADLEDLFGPERGACSGCWCMWFRLGRADWRAAGASGRKAALRLLVERGPPPGVLAYAGRLAVGWCAVGPRGEQPEIERSRISAPIDARPAFAITCFYMRPRWRRKGLMRPLVEGAVALARARGGALIEAYPDDPGPGKGPTGRFRGLAPAFRAAGFVEVARRSPIRPILRLEL